MASGLLLAELTATCNALGYYDGKTYLLEPHCSETAKDLIRYLRRDTDTHEIRRFLGNTKIIQTDLLRIIQCHSSNKELFDIVLRLLVNLTTPALLVYNEVVPKDKTELNQYLEIVSHLQSYKEAFSDHTPWDVLTEMLGSLLNLSEIERDDDVQRLIERILILVRNVLHVPANLESEARPDNDASVHDQVLWALHQSGMLDMVLYIASSMQECTFFMHVMEIICLMVREQPPALLAETVAQRSEEEKKKDSSELSLIRNKESLSKQEKMRKYQGTRHFGGTFVIKNLKSTSDKDIIYHKPFTTIDNISLDLEKKRVKIPKNRQPLKCENAERKSALSVRLILKQFCIEILNAAYNPLMRYVKDILARGKTQDNDESYYFNGMKFFMEFNRHYKFQVKLVSETLSVETFHFIQKYLESWHEMMLTDKAKIPLWSSRMHLALKAYKELLYNLIEMDKREDESIRDSSRVIKSNIFYVIEYREMLLLLIKTYKKPLFSLQYLRDLMETTHVFLKLIEHFAKNKKIFVQGKVRRPKKSKKKVPKNSLAIEQIWCDISPEVVTAIESQELMEVVPFDAASDIPMEEQKIEAMKKIQRLLKEGNSREAVSLLRASREVWPENDCFGVQNLSNDEELACLQEIFTADLNLGIPESFHSGDEFEEDEEDSFPPPVEERSLDVNDFLKSFATPKVLQVCGLLLKNFEYNSPLINHCIAKMMHRIVWDCKLPAMLFQASVFRSFQKLFTINDPKYKELATLAVYIIRKFTESAATNTKILAELLFWKSSREAYDIEMGYGSYQEKSKASKVMWEEHEEDELRKLVVEYKRDHPEGNSKDMIEWILSNMIKERSKLSVTKKLRELHLVEAKPKKVAWAKEEEDLLLSLFEEFKETPDPVGIIMERMGKIRREINTNLLRLGIVKDKSELKKKCSKGPRKKKTGSKESSGSSSSEASSDEEEPVVQNDVQRPFQKRPSVFVTSTLLIKASQTEEYILDGMKWLVEVMKDNLEDIDDDDSVEVPLLPLSENAMKSVDLKQFQQFLLAIGLFSPIELQERYWRFPADWKEEHYSKRIKLLESIVNSFIANGNELSEETIQIIRENFEEVVNDNENIVSDPDELSDNGETEKFNALTRITQEESNINSKNKKQKKLAKNSFKLDKISFVQDDSDSDRRLENEASELKKKLDLEGNEFNSNSDQETEPFPNRIQEKHGIRNGVDEGNSVQKFIKQKKHGPKISSGSESDNDTSVAVPIKKKSLVDSDQSSSNNDSDSDDSSKRVLSKKKSQMSSHKSTSNSDSNSDDSSKRVLSKKKSLRVSNRSTSYSDSDTDNSKKIQIKKQSKVNNRSSLTSSGSDVSKTPKRDQIKKKSRIRSNHSSSTGSDTDDGTTKTIKINGEVISKNGVTSNHESDSDSRMESQENETVKVSSLVVENSEAPKDYNEEQNSQNISQAGPMLSLKRNRVSSESEEELTKRNSPKINKKRHIIDSDDED